VTDSPAYELQAAFERERSFTADVAHELRTPVAELRTLAEVALKYPEQNPELHQRNYKDVLAVAENMQSVVETLLMLSRYDAGVLKTEIECVDLGQLITESWKNFAVIAEKKRLEVTSSVTDELITAKGNRQLCSIIVTNLFANAVEYCPPNGSLSIQLSTEEGRFTFTDILTVVTTTSNPITRTP